MTEPRYPEQIVGEELSEEELVDALEQGADPQPECPPGLVGIRRRPAAVRQRPQLPIAASCASC